MRIVYLNGQYVEEQNAAIPISDRGFLYGDGVFTTVLVENGNICHLDLHLERLCQSCRKLQIRPPKLTENTFRQLLVLNNAHAGSWRLKIVLSGGAEASLGLPMRDCGTVLATIAPFLRNNRPLAVAVYPDPLQGIFAMHKTLSYLERLQIKEWAVQSRVDDAITRDSNQYLLELAFANLIWQVNGTWHTPETSLPILKGVALQVLLDHWEKSKTAFKQVSAKLEDIPIHANLYAVNALQGAVPIMSIDNMHFPVNLQLAEAVNSLVGFSADKLRERL